MADGESNGKKNIHFGILRNSRLGVLVALISLLVVIGILVFHFGLAGAQDRVLYWGSRGSDVTKVRALPAVARGVSGSNDVYLLARLISGEARAEPFVGKVAVGAVVLNRVQSSSFPNSISGVIYQPFAFESVSNGQIWRPLAQDTLRAAQYAISGWDPTHGALFFWNPYKPASPWIWTRNIITQIGKHVFAR